MPDPGVENLPDPPPKALAERLETVARLEAALQEKDRIIQLLLNASGDPAMLLDARGTIFAANTPAASALNRSVEDLLGNNAFSLVSPELAKIRKRHHDSVVRTGHPLVYEEVVEGRRLETRLLPIANAGGKVAHVAVFSRKIGAEKAPGAVEAYRLDLEKQVRERTVELERANARLRAEIEEKRRTEEAFRKSESRYRALFIETGRIRDIYRSLFHFSADAIVIHDLEGRVQYLNPGFTKIFGWTQEELEGRRIPFVPESEKKKTFRVIRELLKTGNPVQGFESRRLTKKGRLLDVSISASRYHDHEGTPAGTLMILRDLTGYKRLEARLRQAHKMEAIGNLAGGVAHDFNNLLQAISGFAQLLLMGKDPADPERNKLEAIEKAAQRARELTRRLLIFGRKVDVQLKVLDLNREVEGACRLLERTIPKMIQIETALTRPLHPIHADPVQLEQILMNLVINARDAMPEGGKLTIRTQNVILDEAFCRENMGAVPGKFVKLTVQDTGCGIEKALLDRIFEPFFTTKECGKGTGLGLAMVYGIVKNHKGYITCHSRVHQGTRFDIYFPAKLPEGSEEAAGGIEGRENIPRGKETILLVEDEASLREIGKTMLQRFGYTVWLADSGEAAVSLYREKKDRIHLVILDLNMPGMGGFKCYTQLTEIDPDVKVVVASGFLEDARYQEVLGSKVKAFVDKPYRLSELLHAVRDALDGKG